MEYAELSIENEFVESRILAAVRGLLTGRVNEILGELEFTLPLVEFSGFSSGSVVVPIVRLSTCERGEKERLLHIDAYVLTVAFALPEMPESELFCYAYSMAVDKALMGNPTLDGTASRVVLTGKKYVPPKMPQCGQGWEVVLSLRVTVEGMGNDE